MKYVDLGLSVLWADCNIGANTPEEFGDYYKWDNIPKGYEIPIIAQYKELRENCTWEWTTQNGVNGYKVTSKVNGNSIFLPAAGSCYYSDTYIDGNSGFYWLSSLNTHYRDGAYYLHFDPSQIDYGSDCCYMWFSVRTIKSKTNFKNIKQMTLEEVNEIIPLKSGMCLELSSNNIRNRLILFQYGDGKLCYTNYNSSCSWDEFKNLDYNKQFDAIKVYQSPTVSLMFSDVDLIFNSDDHIIKELTLQEIADKFGVKIENLRIKD